MKLLFFSIMKIIRKVMHIFEHFNFFWIKVKSKCEIFGIGVLKRFYLAICGMECVNLKTNAMKILGIHFLYN